jgi:hypothetical protein
MRPKPIAQLAQYAQYVFIGGRLRSTWILIPVQTGHFFMLGTCCNWTPAIAWEFGTELLFKPKIWDKTHSNSPLGPHHQRD